MPQFQTQVPHPLRDDLPALLPPGGVAAPAILVVFGILIGERRLTGATMQGAFDDIRSGACRLGQVAEKEFVTHADAGDAHRTLLEALRMGRHHHATGYALRPHWHLWTVGEAAYDLAFWALLELIRGEGQARLHKRMIERRGVFAAGHERQASEIGEDGSRTILSIESEQSVSLWKLGRCEGACDQGLDLSFRERKSHSLREKCRCFLWGEAQIGGAQLGELTARTQSRQGEWRVYPAGDDQVQVWRQVVQEKRERVVDWLRRDDVIVIQDQDGVRGECCADIDYSAQQELYRWRLGRNELR
jgi:hypothetical protein